MSEENKPLWAQNIPTRTQIKWNKKMSERKGKFDLIMPSQQWEMWLTNYVEETGFENCGLFCVAESEEKAKKIFNSLIKIIQDKGIECKELEDE